MAGSSAVEVDMASVWPVAQPPPESIRSRAPPTSAPSQPAAPAGAERATPDVVRAAHEAVDRLVASVDEGGEPVVDEILDIVETASAFHSDNLRKSNAIARVMM
eukprot:7717144-Alexandrium_andersonii.AAC.1